MAQGFMSLRDVLLRYREKIVREWVNQFRTEIGDRYSRRPLDEWIPLFQKLWTPTFHCSSNNSVELRVRLLYLVIHLRRRATVFVRVGPLVKKKAFQEVRRWIGHPPKRTFQISFQRGE